MVNGREFTTRRNVLGAITATGVANIAGCLSGSSSEEETDTVKAAWVVDTPVGDLGWAWAHDRARQEVEEAHDWLETSITEEVEPADSKQVIEEHARSNDIVFGCAFGYMEPMLQVSADYPDVAFEHNTGFQVGENMGLYFGRMYQMRYLLGVAAATISDIDTAGYVAAYPIPEVIRGINAFSLGALSVDDSFTTKVRWTNTWFDPPTEGEAAEAFIDEGVDLMVQHQDSPAALNKASENGIWASGYDAPMGDLAGENYLTSLLWKWEAFYNPTVEAVRDGDWEPDFYWEGVNTGIVDMDEFGPNVPDEVEARVAEQREAIESGDLDVWAGTQFEGESDDVLYGKMESFVDGIDGEVPDS
jgi:basic membrane protein A